MESRFPDLSLQGRNSLLYCRWMGVVRVKEGEERGRETKSDLHFWHLISVFKQTAVVMLL